MAAMAVSPLERSSLGIPGPYAIPFFALLLTLASVPLVNAHLWVKQFPLFVLGWTLAVFSLHIPFIAVVGSLYALSGGLVLRGTLSGHPLVNTALLVAVPTTFTCLALLALFYAIESFLYNRERAEFLSKAADEERAVLEGVAAKNVEDHESNGGAGAGYNLPESDRQMGDHANAIADGQRHFVFGYGSLIRADSRARTAPPNTRYPAVAVRVHSLRRMWSVRDVQGRYTCLGCVRVEGCCDDGRDVECENVVNGVVFYVGSERDLEAYDKRESEYIRVPLPLVTIQPYLRTTTASIHLPPYLIDPTARIWTYIHSGPDDVLLPTTKFPIIQSYIDVVIGGCLEWGGEFAVEFVPWLDDRPTPRYERAELSPDRTKIDGVLSAVLGDLALLRSFA
ncbi:hypothetical protein M427DRAFT_36278 [Gonapodya prolifera JEL478]|uniref:Gamma-glutamylcyclotransferase AIG2-like domain-containing protein n=1 Tax=Gonapodya prolifera (strain JEL478) TaxID=1344416 RepID=A0A139A3Y8_GONPJ|nr:hypothetical protein M427DRAFT_36278 [Gonapodya prolifera JEL478]|eukprot:KXS11083.1 hypothetical protein M427DRAFT_36278 [Gonapodya prolifera JEL478]